MAALVVSGMNMETLASFAVFWGLELLALIVLMLSLVFARWLAVVIAGGVLAMALMAAHFALWVFLAGVGSATSTSQQGYSVALSFGAGSLVALALYFPLAVARHKKLRRAHAASR